MNLPIFLLLEQVIEDGDMSSDITSSSVDAGEARSVAAQIYWTGTSPAGNFYIQGSIDNSNWALVSAASAVSAVSGNSGALIINLDAPAYKYVRIFYDNTSGVGTLQGFISAKS